MVTQAPLRILAFGSPVMIGRLTDLVNPEEVKITGYSEASAGITLLEKEPFDIIIIDNLAKDAESICQNAICLAAAPVALFLRESVADWHKLRDIEVDGFLPDGTGRAEFMARIKAFFRRKTICRPI